MGVGSIGRVALGMGADPFLKTTTVSGFPFVESPRGSDARQETGVDVAISWAVCVLLR